MKLRNLILSSLALCSLAACVKDDDAICGPQEMDAYLSFAATTEMMTKASTAGTDDAGIGKEAIVHSLTAYVFDSNGAYVTSKHVALGEETTDGTGTLNEDYTATEATADTESSITSIKGIHVKVSKPATDGGTSATSFKVVLLANVDKQTVATLTDLKAVNTKSINEYNATAVGTSYLPMHSGELTVTGLTPWTAEDHIMNWCNGTNVVIQNNTVADGGVVHTPEIPDTAGKVTMIRSIARVQLVELKADFRSVVQHADLKFKIDSIYLANVRENALVMGEENTEATYWRGAPNEFEEVDGLIDPAADKTTETLVKMYETKLELTHEGTELDVTSLGFDKYINANNPTSLENYQTRIIITGEMFDGVVSKGRKYFHIPLKLVNDAGNVTSNTFFKVKATITGEGSDRPDEILENACINFQIIVAPWNVVDQDENDTN